jgi:N,N'-diacetyllegionaminate synthase
VSTLIIAEAGVNHNGDMELAKKLVKVAQEAKVDVIKFQSFVAEDLVTKSAEKATYQKKISDRSEFQLEMLQKLELNQFQHQELKRFANSVGLEFLSTGFDIRSMEMLLALGIERIKIPSGEITNLPYLRYVAAQGKEVILSTGMSTLKEIEIALEVLVQGGIKLQNITVLHCTSNYPVRMDEVNLKAMTTIAKEFQVKIGYSDHTNGIEVALAAVALGATIIEKHFTLDRKLPGPDHIASLEPHELAALVTGIRNLEIALGSEAKEPTESEVQMRLVARKSIVAKEYIRKGQVFSRENLTVKRPGSGISPMQWEEIIGSISSRDYSPDDLIEQP